MPTNDLGADRPLVRYDAETHARRIREAMDLLVLALQKPAWRDATGEAWLTKVVRDVDRVRARLSQPFALLIVGDFKRGKSTLINALLGRPIVTMDVAPETVAITEVHYGPALRIEARLADGGRVELREADLPSERLTPILENLPGPVDVIRIEAPVPFLDGITVVDSPGMGDLLWRFDARVAEYLPRADAVIHVVSAISPMSESERGFLKLALRPLDLAKVVFVVNMLDQVRAEEDVARVVGRVTDSLEGLFPDSPVLGVSALYELSRCTGEPVAHDGRAEGLAIAFAELRKLIERRVLLHRDVVRNERGAQEAEAVIERAAADLRRLQRALESSRGELRGALAVAQDGSSAARKGVADRDKRIRKTIGALGEQAAGWMDGLVSRIEAEALPALGALGHEEVQRNLPFFLAETLRDGMAACLSAHQDVILALVDEVSTEAALAIAPEIARGEGAADAASARAGFHSPTWTLFDHLHVVGAVLTMATGGLGAIASAIFGVADQTAGRGARGEHFRARVAESMPKLRDQVAEAVRAAYAEVAEKVAVALSAAQDAEIARISGELEQALAVHDRGVGQVAETTAALGAVLGQLNATAATLAELRVQLRSVAAS